MATTPTNSKSDPLALEPYRIFGPSLVDVEEDDQAAAPKRASPKAKRRRGRPFGAKTRVAHTHVTADEFALLRAVAQGVDLTVAARQYLLWPGRMPERAGLEKLYADLLNRIAASACALPETKKARAMAQALLNLQTVIQDVSQVPAAQMLEVASADAPVPVAAVAASPQQTAESNVPSLEEFAQRFDEDMFSESELIALYEEAFGQAGSQNEPAADVKKLESGAVEAVAIATGPQPVSAASSYTQRVGALLQAIDWLDEHLSAEPKRDDLVTQWIRLSDAQVQALRAEGVVSLGNLIDWITLRGERWHDFVPRYGAQRALELKNWLARWSINPAQGLATEAVRALVPSARPSLTGTHVFLAPITPATWPEALRGQYGRFRHHVPNGLMASDDMEAVNAWFQSILRKSQATQVAYKRAVERLILWAIHERKQPLSSLSKTDLIEFCEFLQAPPPHWVQAATATRNRRDESWRPLRGPMNMKSLNLMFAAVGAMYSCWEDQNYTTINPAKDVIGSKRKDATMDVMRSFSEQDLDIIAKTFDDIEDGPTKRRLAALLMLLETAGLRREEVAKAKWGDLTKARIDGRVTESHILVVEGKGKRIRNVPINNDVFQALRLHLQDRQALVSDGHLSLFSHIKDQDQPLIGVLDERWVAAMDKKLQAERGLQALSNEVLGVRKESKYTVNPCGALSSAAIYSILKAFFRRCAVRAGEKLGDRHGIFNRASTHWLRHTFAHHALKSSGKDLSVVQALLGHKSISTTGLYVKADMTARVEAVNAIRSALGK